MRYFALACDYDETLASRGQLGPATRDALIRVRRSGRRVILVTGREVDDLLQACSDLSPFELVVAENGALIYDPKTRAIRALGPTPTRAFVDSLRAQNVAPLSVGRVMVSTREPNEVTVLRTIRDLGLELEVVFNRGAVMVLPTGVNKATGLSVALAQLKLSPHNVVGVGDGENDHAVVSLCECGVAVANAVPMLQDRADLVTSAREGAGVVELVDRILQDDLVSLAPRLERHDLVIGVDEDGRRVRLPAYGASVLVAGTSGGGKSTFAASLFEQMEDRRYQYCVLDPEGDYAEYEGAVVMGSVHQLPDVDQVLGVLEQPDQNAIVNLLALRLEDRPGFFDVLWPRLRSLRMRTGRPHWLILDETHHLLPPHRGDTPFAPEELSGLVMITVHPNKVSLPVLQAATGIVAIGMSPDETLASFADVLREAPPRLPRHELEAGEAILWWRRPMRAPIWLRTRPPRVERKRHRRKYATGSLGEEKSFYFRGQDGRLNLRVQNLMLFLQVADGVDDETWTYHLRQGDYSRWFRESIRDQGLAEAVAAIERCWDASAAESRRLVRAAVEERYTASA